jgi:cytochrome c heme-lyase
MVNNNNNKSASSTTTSDDVPSLEEAAKYAQTPQPDQRFPLRTDRQVSSIPRGSSVVAVVRSTDDQQQPPPVVHQLPHHQPQPDITISETDSSASASSSKPKNHHWVYPSEQQLYNAMRRKGWKNVPVDSIPTVLQIHNSINERTWDKVLEWEYMMMMMGTRNHSSAGARGVGVVADDSSTVLPKSPRLVRFEGRPKDMTPKAFLFSKILLISDPPFDRHDWYVESYPNGDGNNNNGSSSGSNTIVQRYVIDYYMTEQHDPFSVPIPYVDARPAVDSPRAVWMRTRRFLQDAFPGITAYYLRRQYLQQQEQQQMIQQQLDQQTQQQQQQAPQK